MALLALALGLSSQFLPAAEMTAFALVKEGDKFIAPQAKDKIMQIYSEKSAGSLVPGVWHIDYYDTNAAFRTTEVTFSAGKMTEVKRPKRLLESFSGARQLRWSKLKIDSDRALAIALKEPRLAKLDLRAAQFWLERTATGATWKIRFWAARLDKPDQSADIGDLYISSKSGEVLKTDLHLQKE